MKICGQKDNKQQDHSAPIKGHIYKANRKVHTSFGDFGIIIESWFTKQLTFHSLINGELWSTSDTHPFGTGVGDILWKDVTDKYCLKEI